ncbi:MAG: DUF2828 family protein [Peptostreptococcaceae bacterium]|nr:DUF2828 family protein [Peptostreptococcaceae bacterium]
MSVVKNIKNQLNETFTENGDLAFRSTFDANLDFFGIAGASRYNPLQLVPLFIKALIEDRETALRNLFYLRDVRGGLGERNSFRITLSTLIEYDADLALKLLPYIAEYGRWDDLLVYIDFEKTKQAAADFIKRQLNEDVLLCDADKPFSLCAKWMPSINASSARTRKYAKELIRLMQTNAKDYRQLLSRLRKGKIVERNLTERDYTYDYAALPAKAMNKYQKAFWRNDEIRYEEFLAQLQKGEVKAKVETLYPYEILKMLDVNETLAQAQWKAIERHNDCGNTIVVRDGSGSMTLNPNVYETATSLAILFSEQLSGEFKNKFITFSWEPKLVELPDNDNLKEKAWICSQHADCSNTNIQKVYELLLETSKKIIDPKDYITRVVIISDMEFDRGTCNVPTYHQIKAEFQNAGIPLPEFVYWNVDARRVHFAGDKENPNLRFVSGLSGNVIESIIHNKAIDPVDFMHKTLEKYKFIKEIAK